jgi:hypothetical protein
VGESAARLPAASVEGLATTTKPLWSRLYDSIDLVHPLRTVANFAGVTALGNWSRDRNYARVAELFTSPEGVDRLLEIARYSPTKDKAQILARAFGSVQAQQQPQ